MNPLPAPVVPGKTEAERFNNALRKVLSTPVKAQAKSQPKPIRVEVVPLAATPESVRRNAKKAAAK